ncbi:uncharacterized protein NESG_00940 [Nematocida ausubeli]|uniref:Uncharacterized protein n=1 Tax=Nematocida ausubeli (strain ATCC PRA-371 / ERTm2) TaxID=1913371 RepID=A0A086J3R6_NEMA1|nr:uncharacterized protein NESG_00940 [Nematocida ausubeli]KFG26784.1 hypothetical protein NESG_00940 [Nematocida ausubeli]
MISRKLAIVEKNDVYFKAGLIKSFGSKYGLHIIILVSLGLVVGTLAAMRYRRRVEENKAILTKAPKVDAVQQEAVENRVHDQRNSYVSSPYGINRDYMLDTHSLAYRKPELSQAEEHFERPIITEQEWAEAIKNITLTDYMDNEAEPLILVEDIDSDSFGEFVTAQNPIDVPAEEKIDFSAKPDQEPIAEPPHVNDVSETENAHNEVADIKIDEKAVESSSMHSMVSELGNDTLDRLPACTPNDTKNDSAYLEESEESTSRHSDSLQNEPSAKKPDTAKVEEPQETKNSVESEKNTPSSSNVSTQ